MSVFEILGTILIGPLKAIFELIFSLAFTVIDHPGPAIVMLSLTMNIILLPLYRRADAIQMEARDTENRLKDVVTHIKKTFSGDERMMILQTYYRQNNYSPLSVLSGSISLMLEIPFFLAAYQFLSGVGAFEGTSFGPIADLSRPDGMLVIGAVTINVLPILMTLVNVISSSLYLKGFPLKTKIQLYGMALAFLVLLYNSPAAMVFYWTLNNVFSLIKTLFYRIKNPRKVLRALLIGFGAGCVALAFILSGLLKTLFVLVLGAAAQLIWLLPLLLEKFPSGKLQPKPSKTTFLNGALFLTILTGLLIPGTYVAASPQEYIILGTSFAPIWYVLRTLSLSAGLFLVWLSVFYWLSTPGIRVLVERLIWIACGVMVINYLFFGTNLGILSPDLKYTEGFYFSASEQLTNMLVVIAAVAALYLVSRKWPKVIPTVLLTGALTMTAMSGIHMVQISRVTRQANLNDLSGDIPVIPMSQDGKNVVVLMLDRAISPFIPYIMEEKPELKQQFDGFTYYPNTLSYGGFTNFGTPPLYGGYDYTPVHMNRRSTELLADKHSEALKVVPSLFSQADFDVTVIDPSYAGYQHIPDLSIYDDMPGVSAYLAEGKFTDSATVERTIESRKRNFFFFSLMKTLPVSLQPVFYNNGAYRAVADHYVAPHPDSDLQMYLYDANVLDNLDTMTSFTSGPNTYMFLRSNITHKPTILQEPDFEPVANFDNSGYYGAEGRYISDGTNTVLLPEEIQIAHYHVNAASLMLLGNWFDYLRENGVYDNTRIIIVSDHGRQMSAFDDDPVLMHRIEYYKALLLVKDFDAHGFTTDETFMTNADVPALSLEGLVENPVNPFTGNAIDSSFKTENERHYVILSDKWDIADNNGCQFLPDEWGSVTGDIRDKSNWTYYGGESVFPPMQ